jgi:DNA-binding MarR family transcriptional regulator
MANALTRLVAKLEARELIARRPGRAVRTVG